VSLTANDETYEPKGASPVADAKGPFVLFRDVVTSPSMLMGVKAVWGKSGEPVMCFGSRGDATTKDAGHFQQARVTAKKALERPYLLTIGGGEQVSTELRGRVLELVRVTGAYGETNAFVRDAALRERLSQWPVAVMLAEVYSVVGDPHLMDDLGFPDRRVLENAYDGVRSNDADLAALWDALKDRPLAFRADVLPPPSFRDPGKVQLCSTLYPVVSAAEGKRRYRLAAEIERNSEVAKEAKRLNRYRNGGVLVCEACDLTEEDARLFDAHHLVPLSVGERATTVAHLAILCPTCHRWAHAKGASVHEPLSVAEVGAARCRVSSATG
jgi:5-methylcytosine-specific restriction protein A